MKSKSIFGNMSLVLTIVFLSMGLESFAQEEIAQASIKNNELILIIPKASLSHTVADTVLPTLCNSGKGLVNYEIIPPSQDRKNQRNYNNNCRNSMVLLNENCTEEEFKALQEQKRQMLEQFHDEWQQQLRKERMEIGLGEIIKGFYMQPPF